MEHYLNRILRQQLKGCHVPSKGIEDVLTNIADKMYSLSAFGNDTGSINGVLLVGQEVGQFYEPPSPVAAFVAVCIRNSLLESYHAKGKTELISDTDMRAITGAAIEYWTDRDWSACDDDDGTHDYYQAINGRYPAAWKALKTLGTMDDLAMDYDATTPFMDTTLIELLDQSGEGYETTQMNLQVQDGYSLAIDASLSAILGALSAGLLDLFYTDSFKTVSRNYEKLLRTIEFCMYCEKPFVSANYYISNGHVEKRARLMPVAHQSEGVAQKSNLVPGSRGLHREALKLV